VAISEQPRNDASEEPAKPDLQRRLRRSQRLNVALGAVAVFLLVVVATQQSLHPVTPGSAPASASGSATTSLAAQVARNQADDPMAWGDPKAPVVMVQWTDFRCPFCAAFATQTLPALFAEYIETGKVRYELHDAALFGDQSVDAAVAARAAGAQGKYHEFMSALYAAAPTSGHPDLPKEKLIGFATQAQVPDLEKFKAALVDAALRKQVTDSTLTAQKQGVNSVLFFVIGNQVVSGAQPLVKFQAAIETELAKK
jgi:protein-disulfide isomerase